MYAFNKTQISVLRIFEMPCHLRKEKNMYLINLFKGLAKKEEGQTLAEYALILVLIAVVVIAAVMLLGTQIQGVLQSIANAL